MKLGPVLAAYRRDARLGVRALAREIGTSSATLSRFERGLNVDAATLGKILLWAIGDAKARKTRL